MTGAFESLARGEASGDDWLDGFADLQALRSDLRRQRANGELDLARMREMETLRRWSDALAGLEKEALERFVEETFVGLGLMTAEDAEALLIGLRLFRRREWHALPAHVRAQLARHEALTDGIVEAFRARLDRIRAITARRDGRDLAAELGETRSDRTQLIEIRGALEFMDEVAANDPLLRLRLREVLAALPDGLRGLDRAIDEQAIPVGRIATLICRAVRGILDTVIKLETSNLKARQPRLFEARRERAMRALAGHLRRARELGCAAAVRGEIVRRLMPHPGIFEAYFRIPHPLR